MTPLLSLQNISVGYRKKIIIQGISFDLYAGEFCALLGLNGSGKTTLLKAICGLIPIDSGTCTAGGQDCTRLSEKKRANYISYIPQRYSEMLGVSVIEAVQMGLNPSLGLLAFPARRDTDQVRIALDKIGIGNLSGKIFSQLSEGQKQLVILARSFVQNTPVMLMDEPDSSLDFLNRHRVLDMIRSLIYCEGKAGLIAAHDPNLALRCCDRLILIHGGKISSDLRLSEANAERIEQCLSAIYGNISLLKQGEKYIVLYDEDKRGNHAEKN